MESRQFLGRERELAELGSALESMLAGHGGVFLISGEAGIGKTELAEQFAHRARTRGARALWGRCWESGAPAFWPWIQILRTLTRETAAESLVAELGDGAAYIARMVPEVRAKLDIGDAPPVEDSVRERFQLFDAVNRLLAAAAARRPLVLSFDDVHAADHSSILLLEFVCREIVDSRLAIIATYRDAEIRRQPHVAALVSDLGRDGHRIVLGGLAEAEVGALLENATGTQAPAAVVRGVHRTTEGNPFFVHELVRVLGGEGWLATDAGPALEGAVRLPEEIREVIRRRLAPLPAKCHDVLAVAAVCGREFEIALLEAVCDRPTVQVLEILDAAIEEGVVSVTAGTLGRCRFAHGLFRQTLYDDLPTARRIALHRHVAGVIERLHTNELDAYTAELAHHYYEAVGTEGVEKAIEYNRRAAEQSTRRLAYEAAVGHYQRALDALAFQEPNPGSARLPLLLALADAEIRVGHAHAARAVYEEAAALATELGDGEALVRAAIGYAGRWSDGTSHRPGIIPLLERALAALAPGDSALRATASARLAVELVFAPDGRRRRALSNEAVDMARRIGEPRALAYALDARLWAAAGPVDVEDPVAAGSEILALAERADDAELVVRGFEWRISGLLERGDVDRLDAELDQVRRRFEHSPHVALRWSITLLGAMRAALGGRFAEAEDLANRALEVGQAFDSANAALIHGSQIFGLRRDQGRLGELRAAIAAFAEGYSGIAAWRCGLAFLLAEVGSEPEARTELGRIMAGGPAALPQNVDYVTSLAALAETAHRVDDVAAAARLYELLAPYADRNVVIGGGFACWGSVSRPLALLAATLRRYDDAERHFADARAMHERLKSPPLAARTDCDEAAVVFARGMDGDAERARTLAARALAVAETLGMDEIAERARALARAAAPLEIPANDPCVFRREGDEWLISYDGHVVRFDDLRGFVYLQRLLHEPGRRFDASDLAPAAEGTTLSSSAEAARLRVTKAIQTALGKIRSNIPTLGRHLLRTVKTGRFCVYEPDPPRHWAV